MKNPNIAFVLASSVVVCLIAIFSFNDAKETLDTKQKEFIEYKNVAVAYKSNYENYSDAEFIHDKLKNILEDLGIKNGQITRKDTTMILSVTNLSTASFQVLFTTLLNENFNITKFDVQTNSIVLEIGIL